MEKKEAAEQTARQVYLEDRVKQLMEQVAGYKQVLASNECIMAAMVKQAGGSLVVKMDDVKEATEQKLQIKYQYIPEDRAYALTTAQE